MAEIIIADRVLPLLFDFNAFEMMTNAGFDVTEIQDLLRSTESIKIRKVIIRILANNALDAAGEEMFITDNWLGHHLHFSHIREYDEAINEAIREDFEREELTPEEDKPVDVVLAKLQKKRTN